MAGVLMNREPNVILLTVEDYSLGTALRSSESFCLFPSRRGFFKSKVSKQHGMNNLILAGTIARPSECQTISSVLRRNCSVPRFETSEVNF